MRVFLNQGRGEGIRNRSHQDGSFSLQGKAAGQTAGIEIDDDNAGKTDETAQELLHGEFFITKNKTGQHDGDKGLRTVDDGRLNTGGVSQTHVEEDVLDNSLYHTQLADHSPGTFLGEERFVGDQTAEDGGQDTGNNKANACEQMRDATSSAPMPNHS